MRRKAWRCQGNLVKILGLLKVDQRDSFPPSNGDLLRQPYALALWNLIIRPPRRLRIFLFFLKLLFCSPFFGGDEVFLVITHLEFKPNTVPFRWALSIFSSPFLGRRYDPGRLGPKKFRLWSCGVRRVEAR